MNQENTLESILRSMEANLEQLKNFQDVSDENIKALDEIYKKEAEVVSELAKILEK